MLAFPNLQTERLVLREVIADDADALLAIYSNHDAMRWSGSDPMRTREQALQLVAMFAAWRKQPNPGTRWAICLSASGELIGTIGLFKWNRNWRNAIVGYELDKTHWGRGYMREALEAVLQYGFNTLSLHRVYAEIHPDNLASSGLVQRLGFLYEGRHRQLGYWHGEFHDLDCYALLYPDWIAGRKTPNAA